MVARPMLSQGGYATLTVMNLSYASMSPDGSSR